MRFQRILLFIPACLCIFFTSSAFAQNDPPETPEEAYGRMQISVIRAALSYIGTPYRYGGTSASGFDCSGFVFTVFQNALTESIPRSSRELAEAGTAVDTPEPGDIVIFKSEDVPFHVGIYLGDDYFVHAASRGPRTGVIISSLSDSFYRRNYSGARDIITQFSRENDDGTTEVTP